MLLMFECGIRGGITQVVHKYTAGARSKFWGVSGSEDRDGGDNSIQFIDIGRVGDKSFKELQQKIWGWKGG